MQKFSGGFATRLNLLFYMGLGLGCFYFTFEIATKADSVAIWAGVLLFFLMSSSATFIGVYGLIESFTIYEIDGKGMTRRGWNGTRMMRWMDVTRVDVSGQRDSQLTLRDGAGQKLAIQRGLMDKKRRAELNATLEPYLAPVRERELRDVGGVNTVYYPKRDRVWAGAILLVIMVPLLAFVLSMPVKAGEQWMFAVIMAWMGLSALFFLWMTISFYTQTLTVTPHDLTDRTVFRTRRIPFHHVGSVSSRMLQSRSGTYEVTTIEGDGQKIMLTSQMKDYALLTEYIRRQASETARAEGETQAQKATAKEQKQLRVLMPLISLVMFLMAGGLGWSNLRTARARLERYRLMDTQGQTATGRVTGLSADGTKSERYLLHYAFTDTSSDRRESVSPISYQDYQTTRIGESVHVTYIPSRRDMATIAQSIGRKRAEGDIRSAYFSTGIACLLTPLIGLAPFLQRKRRHNLWVSQAEPRLEEYVCGHSVHKEG